MILFINTSQADLIEVRLIKDNKVIGRLENHEEYKQSELLLSMIDKLFQNSKLPSSPFINFGLRRASKIQKLEIVAVVSGPGAFSALRLGVGTANALAWSLKAPVIEIGAKEAENEAQLINILRRKTQDLRLKTNNRFSFAVPKYGKEPNITQAKN